MSRQRVYRDGRRQWVDEGPAYARRQGWGGSALGYFTGIVVVLPRSVVPLREKDRRRKAAAGEPARRKAQAEEWRP